MAPGWPKRRPDRIVLTRNDFEIFCGSDRMLAARFDEIVSIEAYKSDLITTDLICFEIWLDRDPPLTAFVHEETEGWDQFVLRLAQLPGFDADWYAKVVQPPFAENRAVVYERSSA